MDILINTIIAAVSALITWRISHLYYKKSLLDQAENWLKIESTLLARNSNDNQNDKLILHEKRMRDATQDYIKKGTPKFFQITRKET